MQARFAPLLSVAFVVLLFLVSVDAGAAATFGPKQYVRIAGAPQTFTDNFPSAAAALAGWSSSTATPTDPRA